MQSPKQDMVLDVVTRTDKLSAAEIAKRVGMDAKAVGAHLRRLEAAGKVHVSEWKKGKYGVLTKAYTAGFGISAVHISPRRQKVPKEPKPKKEPAENVDQYLTKNKANIVSHDNRLSHADHIRFMSTFTPHPDPASAWLFNQPAVELQGNKHDLV
jgi:predicted transcriptional regulator